MVQASLGPRKEAILMAVVAEYVRIAAPIGSQHLFSVSNLHLSPATIRAQMAQLEEDGFLTQPHVSSGRVPSVMGYRYFVDRLMGRDPVRYSEIRRSVEALLANASGEFNEVLRRSLVLLAQQTNYTAIVSTWAPAAERFQRIQIVPLSGDLVLVLAVGSRGTVDRSTLRVDGGVSDSLANQASNLMTASLRNSRFGSNLVVPPTNDPELDALVCAVIAVLHDSFGSEEVDLWVREVYKTAAALEEREKVTRMIEALEQQLLVVELIRGLVEQGTTVSIGEEIGVEALNECALVVAPCEVGGEIVGSVGVLGPMRMDYPLATTAVAAIGAGVTEAVS